MQPQSDGIRVRLIERHTRRELAEKHTQRNTSGVRGVRLRTMTILKKGKTYRYEHVEATWSPEPGRVVKVSFSVSDLGKREAWRRAVEARKKGVAAIRD